MHWDDEAIVLSVKPHGETVAIAEVLTRAHGRHLGLVHGGRSRRLRPTLQPGNHVDATWKARLSEHLGSLSVELRRGYAALAMADAAALDGLTSLTSLLRLLPERDPHPDLFELTLFVLGFLDDADVWPALLVRWELALLDEMGAGLDLSRCAATGREENLVYVSPKSGRAVSAEAGAPYADRLLRLPRFLRRNAAGSAGGSGSAVGAGDLADGFALTGYFLVARVMPNVPGKKLPDARGRMIERLIERQGAREKQNETVVAFPGT